MFCPKCGIENSDQGKFCRKCGSDLRLVADAMSGKLTVSDNKDRKNKKKPTWESALILLSISLASFIISIILAFQPMGAGWWFWLLFVGFTMLALGIGQIINLKQSREDQIEIGSDKDVSLPEPDNVNALPPKQTDFVSDIPDLERQTEDLVVPSVVEETTRKLKMDAEGKTMKLPKKDQ